MKRKKYTRRNNGSSAYTKSGVYFVTICVKNNATVLGNIENGKMILSKEGEIVREILESVIKVFPGCVVDEYVVMPNHVHILFSIDREQKDSPGITQIIDWIKNETIQRFVVFTKEILFLWQRSFYQHQIKDNEHLLDIKNHIRNNPLEWEIDRTNPDVK
jgi:putative transposase